MDWAAECRVAVDGFAASVVLVALPLALVLSVLTLFAYRRAVARAMRKATGEPVPVPPVEPAEGRREPLAIAPLDGEPERGPLDAASRSALSRLTAVYAVAGAVHAAIVTALMFHFNGLEFLPFRFAAIWLVYAWPVIPVLALTAAGRPKAKRATLLAYFVALLALDTIGVVTGIIRGAHGQILGLWLIEMGPPTLLIWLLGNRALRCVGLLALLVALGLSLAFFGGFWLLGCVTLTTRSPLLLAWFDPLRWAIVLAAGVGMFLALRVLAARMQRAKTSDLMLTIDSWWLVITLLAMLQLYPGMKAASPLVLLAFAAYKGVVVFGLKWAQSGSTAGAPVRPPALLMLRVFGHARRTERLLDEIGLRWRYVGPINLIAGTDIATSYFEPDEVVRFVSGRLGDAYVADAATLDAKLARADAAPFADGRYGLNDFFCRDNTWRACVHALAARSDAVLMDLRSFGPANRGCEFELGLLLERVDLTRVLFLVDASTDVAHLEKTLAALWAGPAGGGVNAGRARPTVSLLRADARGDRLAESVVARLFGIAGGAFAMRRSATVDVSSSTR